MYDTELNTFTAKRLVNNIANIHLFRLIIFIQKSVFNILILFFDLIYLVLIFNNNVKYQ